MAGVIHYRFKSAKAFSSLPIRDHFIKLADFKKEIMDSKFPGFIHGRDNVRARKSLLLVISNAQTGYQYSEDEGETLIVKNSSLIIRCQVSYSVHPLSTATTVHKKENPTVKENSYSSLQDLDDFGDDPFAPPQPQPIIKAKTEEKITLLDDLLGQQEKGISGLEQNNMRPAQPRQGYVSPMMIPQPPRGYVCHRCHVPGHFIQHCPTNGDPSYDKKNPVTIYPLPQVSVSASTSSSRSSSSSGDLPAELYCPLCKQVMKDAVMRRCCFDSFCEGCIRNHIVSRSMCFCKATNVSAEHFVPNKTVRDTISRLLDSNSSGSSSSNTSNISQAKLLSAPIVHQPTAPSCSTNNFAGHFRQHILQQVAQAALGKQDKEQKLHSRSDSEGLQSAKRPKIEFPAQYCMPSAHPSYQGNWNYGSQGHPMPLVSPQLGF